MKKIIICIVILFCSFFTKAQETKLENSLLWKIEHKDIKQPSYLFGTIHIMCAKDFKISEKVTKALKTSDNLVMEVNLSDPKEMMSAYKLSISDKKLSEQLSETQYKYLDSLVQKEMKVPLKTYENFSLFTIYSLLIQKALPCDNMKMYEFELMNIAKKQQKEVKGLETIADQMEFVNKAFDKDFLFAQFKEYAAYKESFQQMITTYKNEDLNGLSEGMSDERFMNENADYWMLTHRNRNWVKLIPEMMQKESNFFAVGAGHLSGENGVIHLLRKQGYKVTPVMK